MLTLAALWAVQRAIQCGLGRRSNEGLTCSRKTEPVQNAILRGAEESAGATIACALATVRLWPKCPPHVSGWSGLTGAAWRRERELSVRARGLTDYRPPRSLDGRIRLATVFRYGISSENRCGPAKVGPHRANSLCLPSRDDPS